MPLPVSLDTDIGTDIDDAYALLLALASPEIDLRAVTVVNGDTYLRAAIARSLLRQAGRTDIPVLAGAGAPLTSGVTRSWMGHEGKGADLSETDRNDYDKCSLYNKLSSLISGAYAEGRPLTLITIGPLTNLALALAELEPETIAKIGRIFSMASSFSGFGPENAQGEHNVACDPEAFRRVVSSGLPITLVGLNVTKRTSMSRADMERITACGGPLARSLAEMHRIWFEVIGRDRSPMHDALAVAAAFQPEMIETIPVTAGLPIDSMTSGAVVYNPAASNAVTNIRVAVSAGVEAFHRMFFRRVESVVGNSTAAHGV